MEYKKIKWFRYKETNYYVSKCGKLLTTNWKGSGKNAIMKPASDKKGYMKTVFVINGKNKPVRVHRIIAEVLIPNPDNKPIVNHINFNKSDNSVENLEWVTYKENTQHAIQAGRFYYNAGWNKGKTFKNNTYV
jgi:hypothetical protein